MPSIDEYKAGFKHTDWVDYVSLVQAEGGDGFNSRFHALEREFVALENTIKGVREALAQPIIVTLAPTLTSLTFQTSWNHEFGGALKPPGVTSITGMMPVILPQGYRINSLRATGGKTGGNLSIQLFRHGLVGVLGDSLVTVQPALNGSFDETQLVPLPEGVGIDNNTFRYYMIVFITDAAADDEIQLRSFQIVCNPT